MIEVRVALTAEELVSGLLFELGSTGIVTLDESVESVVLGAYFEGNRDGEDLARLIGYRAQAIGLERELMGLSLAAVPEQDWMQKWKEGFEPINVGKKLCVAPSWRLSEAPRDRIVIRMDPGMAFGTGTHETTRLCLELIEMHWKGGSLLDIGTGTGILAIAAALLEPGSRITAVDVDPLAVETARENAALNGVEGRIEILEADPRKLADARFEVVAANLTAETIIELSDVLERLLKSGGFLIASGILTTLALDVESSLRNRNLIVVEREQAGEWSAIVSRKT